MSDSSWPTTQPQSHRASGPQRASLHDALDPGIRLGEFEIVRVLGTGAFGIVYLAHDHVLLRDVAIKEYMPASLAGRRDGLPISLRSPAYAAPFERGLESFLSEARLLASFDHPSLVKVHRFWKGNGTAYMAMQCYPGATLREVRRAMSEAPGEGWLMALVEPLLGALDLLHGQGVFHRDISPDNILILPDGRPVLLDFGSARRVIANTPQFLTALLTPSFAPVEQYANEAEMRQGPWTDLYALGATLRFVLEGSAPTPSVMRAVSDVLPALATLPRGESLATPASPLLATIDWMMALAPEARPRDVETVRRALRGQIVPPVASPQPMLRAEERIVVDPVLPSASHATLEPELAAARDASTAQAAKASAPVHGGGVQADMDLAPAPRARSSRDPRHFVAGLALLGLAVFAVGAWTLDGAGRASPALTSLAAALRAPPGQARSAVVNAFPPAVVASTSAPPRATSTAALSMSLSGAAPAALAPASDSLVRVAASLADPGEAAGRNGAAPLADEAASAAAPARADNAEAKARHHDRLRAVRAGSATRAPAAGARASPQNARGSTKGSPARGGACDGMSILTRLMCSLRECKATTASTPGNCTRRYANRTGEAA